MKVLIQQVGTGMFFKSLGRWTQNPKDALAFCDSTRAHDYKIYHRLTDTTLVPLADSSSPESHAPLGRIQVGAPAGA